MARVIKLKESDITNIVRRIINERGTEPPASDIPGPTFPEPNPFDRGGSNNVTLDEIQEVFQARTIEDVYKKYEGLYNNTKPEDRVGAISPQDFRTKSTAIIGDPYTDPTGGDPQADVMILLGMLLISAIVYFASHVWPGNCC